MKAVDLPFAKNQMLFGHSDQDRIVAVEFEEDGSVKVFRRGDGQISTYSEPFKPFFLLSDLKYLEGFKAGFESKELSGSHFFKNLVSFNSWKALEAAKKNVVKMSGFSAASSQSPQLFINDPVHQYLLITGKTLFKGLAFEELKRLQLDIETYCKAGFEFSNPNRPEDRIIAISMSDNTGFEAVIKGKELSEPEMLQELCRIIGERDPDVIEGHNLMRFDLPYIEKRAELCGVNLSFGRDSSPPVGHASRLQVADRTIDYTKWEIHGRHIIDTFILAQYYDIASHELESFSLKDIARSLNVASPDRTYISGDTIAWHFDNDPERLFAYALDDVRETRAISELLSYSYFMQTQIFPYSYQNVTLRGNATKINSLFLREYLRQGRSIPALEAARSFAGGYTDIFFTGVAQNVLYCDVQSLYPSIVLTYGIFPRKDDLRIFERLLRDLKQFRLQAKEMAKKAKGPKERTYFEALQSTFKILINSFYGYLGHAFANFCDYDAAEKVASKGREILKSMIDWLKAQGCQLIEIDTDGIYFVPPSSVKTPEDEGKLVAELAGSLQPGILVELAGRYKSMFSYKIKNYALLDYSGNLIIRGSGLRSRGLEKFQRSFIEGAICLILDGQPAELKDLLERRLKEMDEGKMDIKLLMKTETMQDSLEAYLEKVKQGKRNPSALYELALKSERKYQPGDQLSYYVTGNSEKVSAYENCKLASEFDPGRPDVNIKYYKKKLKDLYAKFDPFLGDGNE